jgi:DNA repair protein RecO (recombination protein O)
MRSALSGSTELLCYADFVLFKNRERHSVDHADAIRTFFGLRGEIERLSLASYFAELTAELAEKNSAEAYLKLLLNTLHFLEKGSRSLAQLKALFELRILTLSGYMPNLVACRTCARYEAEIMQFSLREGDLLCPDCAPGHEAGTTPLPPGGLAARRHLIYCEPEKLFRFTLSDEGMKLLGMVAEQYLQIQLEKTFPTLEFYRGLSVI